MSLIQGVRQNDSSFRVTQFDVSGDGNLIYLPEADGEPFFEGARSNVKSLIAISRWIVIINTEENYFSDKMWLRKTINLTNVINI